MSRTSYSLVLLAALLGSNACRDGSDARHSVDSLPLVRVAYLPFASDLALFVAKERGYFEEAGIRVELVEFQAANDNLNALVTGKVDVSGMLGFPTLLAAFEKDSGAFRAFLGTTETEAEWASAILVPIGSRATSVADLRGKTVGTYSGTTQLLNLRSILQRFFDPDHDVTIRQVQAELQLPALQSGQFDALFTIEPAITTAVTRGIARILVENPRYRYILKPFPVTACAVSTRYLKEHRNRVDAVYRALVRAIADIERDPIAARVFLPKYTHLDDSVATRVRLYHWWTPDEVDPDEVQKLADLFRTQGLLKQAVNVNVLFISFE